MFVKVIDGTPERYSIERLRRDNPAVSFPDSMPDALLADWSVYPVAIAPLPATTDAETARRGSLPTLVDGVWTLSWTVERKPDAQIVAEIKQEAARRILVVIPEWKQRNLTARAAQLAAKGKANWTAEEQAEWNAGEAVWTKVKAIRAASNVLETSDPIPPDFRSDTHWP